MATYDFPPDSRKVDASRATVWLSEAWQRFSATPGVWIAIAVAAIVIYVVVSFVPGLPALLTPVLMAGLLQCARNSAGQGPLTFEQMFAGFQNRLGNLLLLGLLALIGFALIAFISFVLLGVVGGASLFSAIQHGDIARFEIGTALLALLLAIAVWLLLSIPLTMAVWFAPALVYFDGMAPVSALKSSYSACLRNWLALSIYGLLMLMLAFIASIPMFLGWLLLLPVAAISVYLSFREIFH